MSKSLTFEPVTETFDKAGVFVEEKIENIKETYIKEKLTHLYSENSKN
jgi:hypothetical protein